MPQQPYRPSGEITQGYNDGLVTVYSVTDTAEPGRLPVEKLTEKVTLRYAEQRLGIQRYYAGKQNQIQVERVIRTPRAGGITNQDIAVTQDGRKYRIDLVQAVLDVFPPSQDITLVKYQQGVTP